jgi:hypothetical protein
MLEQYQSVDLATGAKLRLDRRRKTGLSDPILSCDHAPARQAWLQPQAVTITTGAPA